MIPIIGPILTGLGSIVTGFFSWKEAQANTVIKAIDVVKSIDDNDATSTAALADALQKILTQGSWLERNWRAWLMVLIMILVGFYFFGYTPPNLDKPLSPMMERCFNLLEIGLGGYIVRRGIVDIVRIFNIGSILKTLINKKIV